MASPATFLKRTPAWLRDRAPYLAMVVPILLSVYYACTFGVNVLWSDQFEGMLPLFEKWYAGTLRLADFWALYYEHRHLFPRLVMFLLGLWTKWNVLAELAVIQVLVIFNLLIVLTVFRRHCVSARQLWLMLPLALLLTSWRQGENFLFGWQIVFMLTIASALGAFFCLHRMSDSRRLKLKFTGAIAAATVATYSSGFGPLVWPVGVGPLLLLPLQRRKKLTLAGIWLALGIAEWLAYFWGYSKSPLHPDLAFSCEYFANSVGGALFPSASLATVGGVMILVLAAIALVLALKDGKADRYSFWLAAIAFGLLTLVVTTLGRSGLGAEQALASRYATCSLLVVVGIYGILSARCIEGPSRLPVLLWVSLFSLVVIGLVHSTGDGYRAGVQFRANRQYQAFVFCTSRSQPDETLNFLKTVSPAELRRHIEFLRQRHWNLFASDALAARYALPDASLPTRPAMARLTLHYPQVDKETGRIVVGGWAVDETGNDVVGGVYLEFDGVRYPAYYGEDRKDVARDLKNDNIRYCGFQRSFSARQLSAGRHQLAIKVLTKDRAAFYAPIGPVEFTVGQ